MKPAQPITLIRISNHSGIEQTPKGGNNPQGSSGSHHARMMAPDKSHIAYGAVFRFPRNHREPPAFTVGHSDGGDTDEKGISHYGDGCHGGGNHDDRAGRGARLGPPRFRHWTRTGVRSGSGRADGWSDSGVRTVLLGTRLRLLWSDLLLRRRTLRLLRWSVLSAPLLLSPLLVMRKARSIAPGFLLAPRL